MAEVSVRLLAQPVSQRFPAPDQIANGQRLLGMLDHDGSQDGHLVPKQDQSVLNLCCTWPHSLVDAEGVARQDNSLVGFLIGHIRDVARQPGFGQWRLLIEAPIVLSYLTGFWDEYGAYYIKSGNSRCLA